MRRPADPEGRRLPVKLDSTSNGEFCPFPLDAAGRHANRLAQAAATANARHLRLGRRAFLVSACGAASTLLAFNAAFAAAGHRGGRYELPSEAALDPAQARAVLEGDEFIFDVQGHFIGRSALREGDRRGPDDFLRDVFHDSDTDMMALSFTPARRDAEPLTIEEADGMRDLVERLEGRHRLLLHGRVNPNQDGDLQDMNELAERWRVAAWKTYTQWGPDGRGYALTEDAGLALIEKARALGVPNICVHKGIPFGRRSYEHSLCDDVAAAARQYPDVNFLVYHSGYIPRTSEGPLDTERLEGIDGLVNALRRHGVAPGANVYAELGSTWRLLMRDPDSAAHTLGKLLRYVGERNVLWGTDSIWYGSPQDQIQAFRTFQIDPELRERWGYPELTPALRAGVFGLNATRPYRIDADEVRLRAARDDWSRARQVRRAEPDPHFRTFGPRTRREFLAFRARHGSGPG